MEPSFYCKHLVFQIMVYFLKIIDSWAIECKLISSAIKNPMQYVLWINWCITPSRFPENFSNVLDVLIHYNSTVQVSEHHAMYIGKDITF